MSSNIILSHSESTEHRSQIRQTSILDGRNSSHVPSPKRHVQLKQNNSFRAAEKAFDKQIADYLEAQGMKLNSIKVIHNSPQLKVCSPSMKYTEANGFCVVILDIEGQLKHFGISICDLEDTYSRLDARFYAKRHILNNLLNHGLSGLRTIPVTPKMKEVFKDDIDAINATTTNYKICNHIVKTYIKKPKEVIKTVSPLASANEQELVNVAKEFLVENFDFNKEGIETTAVYFRNYSTDFFSGLLATPEWFRQLQNPKKQMDTHGGFTVCGFKGTHAKTGVTLVAMTIATCSHQDNFDYSIGRKQCAVNIVRGKLKMFSSKQPIENIKESLIHNGQVLLKYPVNLEPQTLTQDLLVPSV